MNAVHRSIVGFVILYLVSVSSASQIILSDHSSDETPASILDATLDFSVSGSVLTLQVTNNTSSPNEYDMNAVFFNALDSSNVAGLTLTSPSDGGWDLAFNKHAGGFGTFDFRLEGGVGIDPDQIFPGSTETFVFNILGTAPFFDTDFTSDLSTIPPGDMPSFGAAKFVEGPGDDSAYGATAPEPATLVLLALGSLTLLRTRRR